ncbi:hypothetical protein AX279_00510 [Pseudomonas sp. J237]|jgi:hypothetical protein|nr:MULTISPECIES: hypothetical protein [Pseudomonas]OEO27822.1 hypothetical protein AX279_00510 [Pseudomonas sp. J237]
MTNRHDEPAFLEDDDPHAPLPTFISTTNAYQLYGLREGETVLEAMARSKLAEDVQLPLELPIWVSKRPSDL